ncbi:caspase family protein [Bradyrhizobium genosp. L]|uniref:caspase family protein n=1 Tax=Bradyrhizobium genosp. L TaxID=83637 RepID=UPI0018A30765|nr:caspase family protein [Bradyrhizobium genosp. L]QPF82887.1 caspase family protein [Bradyrhizobium genosp. L]
MSRTIHAFCLTVAMLVATVGSVAAADRRVALVIGNSAYKSAPTLSNTISDATAIAGLLKSSGFEVVISRNDLGVVDFKRAVREFLLTAENADVAVVYYAGHGVEIGGTNYLIPVDAKLSRDYDIDDEAVALDRLIWALQPVRRLRLILLDACRDNPFPTRVRSAGLRSNMKGGLGKLEDVSADTLVAYAAKAGSVSYDGDGVNSPYATALLRHLTEPGVDIRIALGRVRDDVISMTGGRQEPFIYGSLGGATISLVSNGPPKAAEPIALAPAANPSPASKPAAPAASRPAQAPVAAAPGSPPPAAPASPKPAATSPSARVALAPNPPPAQPAVRDTVDPAVACSRDEQRLARLRSDPSPGEIAKFRRELVCERLRAQVQRLLESVSIDPQPQAAPAQAAPVAAAPTQAVPTQAAPAQAVPAPTAPAAASKQAQRQAPAPQASAADVCARDAARLAELRREPSVEAFRRFEQEIDCEHIRPQLQRLRESLGL